MFMIYIFKKQHSSMDPEVFQRDWGGGKGGGGVVGWLVEVNIIHFSFLLFLLSFDKGVQTQ